MPDTVDRVQNILLATRENAGPEAAVLVAKQMIETAAAWISQERGPDEARRVLQMVGAAQGPQHQL